MATSEDLKTAYQIIAECQALHPDPLDEMVEDDEVGSGKYIIYKLIKIFILFIDIDYGNEHDNNENGDGNNEDDDPYGYNAHFASTNQGTRGVRFGGHRRGQHDDQGRLTFSYNSFSIESIFF